MYFAIQTCNPIFQSTKVNQVDNLSEAIEEIFLDYTEEAFFLWNWVPIRISYKYDLSVIVEDLLLMLTNLLNKETGSHRVYWGSNTFRGEWLLDWDEGNLTITTTWDSVAGNYEDLLNSRNKLEITLENFLREWKALLKLILDAIKQTDIRIVDQESFILLQKIEATISGVGRRYIDETDK